MNYVYQYDICALILLILLIILYHTKNNYVSISNKIYLAIVCCSLIATLSDLATVYLYKHNHLVPVGISYVVNIIYLLSYTTCAVLFYFYILAIIKQNNLSKSECILGSIIFIINTALLLTTPFTKLIIYFDKEINYQHGILFPYLFVNAVFLLVSVLVLFIKNRYAFKKHQTVAIGVCTFAMIGAIIIQGLYPAQLIGNFVCSIFLILGYTALQNPSSYIDKFSHCYNQNAFYDTIKSYMEKNIPFKLVAFRLDGFQYVQQLLGGQASNLLINSVSFYLNSKFTKNNIYYLSECQFVVLLQNEEPEPFITKIQEHFKYPFIFDQLEISLTPYICILHYPDFAISPEDINDAIKYTFKEIASNHEHTVIAASGASLDAKKRENNILYILKRAIRNNEFEVYYQPIYNIDAHSFTSAEALIRLRDEQLGYISPEEFIPLAEHNGLIIEIGDIVFRTVCEFIQSHKLSDLGIKFIEVNLSTLQCMQENLAQRLIYIMKEYNVPPHCINFEITETAGKINEEVLRKNMNELINIGTSFSMDDYGTGFSTANYLISLPMSIVKIDKSILWPAMKNPEAFIILRHTVQMLRALHKKIVVEGVETEEMSEILIEMGCDYLQGYLYSKPIPAQEYIAFLKTHNNLISA